MTDQKSPKKLSGDNIQVSIGDNAKDIIAGKNIQKITNQQYINEITNNDIAEIQQLFEELKAQIDNEVPHELIESTLQRTSELEAEILSDNPDLTTIEYVKNWITKNIPQLTASVTTILINPTVSKVLEIGSGLAEEALRNRFGL